MMKVLILQPRIDIPFKDLNNGYVPQFSGPPNDPIRIYWDNFVLKKNEEHHKNGDSVTLSQKALWQFDPKYIDDKFKDYLVYVPHHNKETFPLKNNTAMYYMQTVFPKYFTCDSDGWGPGQSFIKLTPQNVGKLIPQQDDKRIIDSWFDNFKGEYTTISKFNQPNKTNSFPYKDYLLFTCQIPHDEVIKQFGIPVIEALRTTLEYCRETGTQIIVKSHPVNPGSMKELCELTISEKYKDVATWVDKANIHQLIENCKALVTVNSGTGFEAILHEKPIITYGMSEYIKLAKCMYPFSSSMKGIFFRDESGFEKFPIDQYRNWLYWYIVGHTTYVGG